MEEIIEEIDVVKDIEVVEKVIEEVEIIESTEMLVKHYARLNEQSQIIKGFSTAFEQPLETDVCINENGGRHFEIDGIINPCLFDGDTPLYKYENNEMTETTTEEREAYEPTLYDIKTSKIAEFRLLCDADIVNGFDSDCFDGTTVKHYSLSSNDQVNILGSMIKVSAGITPTYKWDDYNGICFDWTAIQMMALTTTMGVHITTVRDKYALLKTSILAATTQAELNLLEW